MRQVFAVEDGVMRGRRFMRDQDEVGADVVASLQGAGNSRVLAVHPSYLKAGESAELRIVGSGLAGDVTLPAGVKLIDTVKRSATEVVVRVQADAAARGVHPVAVGKVSGGALALYDSVAAVKVLPAFAVARIGGNGTPTAKVEARFDAEAWAAGADGKAGTEDDFRIGVMPAKWSVEPFNEVAAHDQDVKFAGLMDAASGVFVPGDAGPNPARRMSASNVGNLKVVAEVEQGGERLRGEGQVIVAPPRWNNPPLP
jgi:quinohemoprotein amine dehydrogenase